MKKLRGSAGWIVVTVILIVFFVAIYGGIPQISLPSVSESSPTGTREIVQMQIAPDAKDRQEMAIPATKLPEFTYDLNEPKLQQLQTLSENEFKKQASATITHASGDTIETNLERNKEKHQLIAHPKDIPNFKPGKYKLSLTLRTLEGEINLEQDFTWGVIAVNTNKSIYKPGDVATIGMGVLNDLGETQCKTGENSAKVWLTVTDPKGTVKEYSTEENSIKDSGQCGPITVTNEPDFVSIYLVSGPGIYKMKVTAEVKGVKRSIDDYFKVQNEVDFDIERTSFPTRIYPQAAYKVLFTVKATDDYAGSIEEFMPSDFKLEKISDDGNEETVGEFKKITWQVTLKKGETKKFTYIIHFPQVSPEFYLMGPIKIGSFKEARQWQIASDLINSTSGLVSYEDNGGNNTFSRVWTGTTWNPALSGVGDTLDTSPGDSRWFREVSSPKTGEKLVALVDQDGTDTGTDDELYVFRWSGSAWTQDLASGTTSIDLASGTMDTTRGFDIAYEELSGDALFVYSDGSSNQLLYYKRVSGTWDASPSNAGTAYSVFKKWVRLEPQFGSDNILVGYLNDSELVGAMIWNGSSFGDQFADNAGTATATSDEQAFDIAWERNSGTPMVFWGGAANNNLIYREFVSGSWQAEVGSATNTFTTDVDWIMAASDPVSTSNNIALGIQESAATPVCRFAVWTGSSVTFNGTTATCVSNATNNLIDTAFENTGGRAMFVYVPDNGTTDDDIAWLTWTSGGGFTSATTMTMNPDVIEAVQLTSDLNTNSMMLLFHDNAGDLYHLEWDGGTSAWSTLGTAIYNNIMAAADDNSVPYGFGFDRNLETLAAYTWFANANSVTPGSAYAAQDTPYTLTSANQQFRLRLLLYYPDNLAINGRNYRLQFVDPGTGTCAEPTGGTPSTWTNVAAPGAPGATEISYANNGTPSDGDNISTVAGDPTYLGKTVVNHDYEEGNTSLTFTNSVSAMTGDQVGKWDFSLIDNTTFDANPSTFCFRVVRDSNNLVLQIGTYPKITTAALNDVLLQGGTLVNPGTLFQ